MGCPCGVHQLLTVTRGILWGLFSTGLRVLHPFVRGGMGSGGSARQMVSRFPLYLGATQAGLPWGSALGVVGSVGLSVLIVAIGVSLARRERFLKWAFCAVLTAVLGFWQPGLEKVGTPTRVAVVQGGIHHQLYEVASLSEAARQLVRVRYVDLTEAALEQGASLVILPEAAFHRPVPLHNGRLLSPVLPVWSGTASATTRWALILSRPNGPSQMLRRCGQGRGKPRYGW